MQAIGEMILLLLSLITEIVATETENRECIEELIRETRNVPNNCNLTQIQKDSFSKAEHATFITNNLHGDITMLEFKPLEKRLENDRDYIDVENPLYELLKVGFLHQDVDIKPKPVINYISTIRYILYQALSDTGKDRCLVSILYDRLLSHIDILIKAAGEEKQEINNEVHKALEDVIESVRLTSDLYLSLDEGFDTISAKVQITANPKLGKVDGKKRTKQYREYNPIMATFENAKNAMFLLANQMIVSDKSEVGKKLESLRKKLEAREVELTEYYNRFMGGITKLYLIVFREYIKAKKQKKDCDITVFKDCAVLVSLFEILYIPLIVANKCINDGIYPNLEMTATMSLIKEVFSEEKKDEDIIKEVLNKHYQNKIKEENFAEAQDNYLNQTLFKTFEKLLNYNFNNLITSSPSQEKMNEDGLPPKKVTEDERPVVSQPIGSEEKGGFGFYIIFIFFILLVVSICWFIYTI